MRDRWSTPMAALHWLSAMLIVGLALAGFVMTDMAADAPGRLLLSRLHSLGGIALMALTVARLSIRLRGGTPAPLPLTAPHRRFVGVVHGLLYAALFGLGASGALTGARSAWPQYLRGEIDRAPALEAMASREVHEALVFALLSLVALHVAGVALQQIRRGGVIARMIPLRGAPSAREVPDR